MKILFNDRYLVSGEEAVHRGPHGDVPPHIRKEFVSIEYEEDDEDAFIKVFKDVDSARSNMAILMAEHVPPEVKIVAAQLLDIVKEVG
jgi:hypothetical protein